jgi:hypothetical protein
MVVDLKAHRQADLHRLVDDHQSLGHLNFDDFKFYDEPPKVPAAKPPPPPEDVVKMRD